MSALSHPAYDRVMRSVRTLLALLALVALVGSPAAVAKEYAPPGRAGTSEYAEDIPTAGGNAQTPAMGGGNTTAAQIDKLGGGKAGVRKLTRLGKSGAAAAQFAQQTAPTRSASSSAPRAPRSGSETTASGAGTSAVPSSTPRTQATLRATGGSAVSALGRALDGSQGGIGLFLPLLLISGAFAATAWAVVRARRPHSDASQP